MTNFGQKLDVLGENQESLNVNIFLFIFFQKVLVIFDPLLKLRRSVKVLAFSF